MLSSIWTVHEGLYTFVFLPALLAATVLRVNFFSLVYGCSWLFLVGLYPHPFLRRRRSSTKFAVCLLALASVCTVLAQSILQIVLAVDSSVDMNPATSKTARILGYFGWIEFDQLLPTLRAFLPDVAVACLSVYVACLLHFERWQHALFAYEPDRFRAASAKLRQQPYPEAGMNVTLVVLLACAVAQPSLLSSWYMLVFAAGCLALFFGLTFDRCLMRAWLWAVTLGYAIINLVLVYVVQFDFIADDLTPRDRSALGLYIFGDAGGLVQTHMWTYITSYACLAVLYATLSYWARAFFAVRRLDDFRQLDRLDSGKTAATRRLDSSAAAQHSFVPAPPSDHDDSDASETDGPPRLAPRALSPATGRSIELLGTASALLLDSGGATPSWAELFFMNHGWKLVYLGFLTFSLCVPSILPLVLMLVAFGSAVAPAELSKKMIPLASFYSLGYLLALFVMNLGFFDKHDATQNVGLVVFTYPLPFLFALGGCSSLLSYCHGLCRRYFALAPAAVDPDLLARLAAAAPAAARARRGPPAATTASLGLAISAYLQFLWYWLSQFLMWLARWTVELTILLADKIALGGLFICGLASRPTILSGGYMLIFFLFCTFPRLAKRFWVVLVVYSELVIGLLVAWQVTWTQNVGSSASYWSIFGLTHWGSFAHAQHGVSPWNIWYGLFWNFVIFVFSCLVLWLNRSAAALRQAVASDSRLSSANVDDDVYEEETEDDDVSPESSEELPPDQLFLAPKLKSSIVGASARDSKNNNDDDNDDDAYDGKATAKQSRRSPAQILEQLAVLGDITVARYGLVVVYLCLLLIGVFDTLSFVGVFYMLVLVACLAVHVLAPGRAGYVVAQVWFIPLCLSLVIFVVRYAYQFQPLSDLIEARYARLQPPPPFSLPELGLENYYESQTDRLFPGRAVASLVGSGVVFVLFVVMQHSFNSFPPGGAYVSSGPTIHSFSALIPAWLRAAIGLLARAVVLHAHKALLFALFLTSVGNLNALNLLYQLAAVLCVVLRYGPVGPLLRVPLSVFAAAKILAQMFFRFDYFLSLGNDTRDLAVWFGFDQQQPLWDALIGDVLVLACFALTALGCRWLQATDPTDDVYSLRQTNDLSGEPCSLFVVQSKGIFDPEYQDSIATGIFATVVSSRSVAGKQQQRIDDDNDDNDDNDDADDRKATPTDSKMYGVRLLVDSLLWYVSNFFIMHGYLLLFLFAAIDIFVRLDVLGFPAILFLGLAGLLPPRQVLLRVAWLVGYLMMVLLLQYVFLLGLPPVGSFYWPWDFWSPTLHNAQIEQWLILDFNRWELLADFLVLFVAAMICRAGTYYRPLLDTQEPADSLSFQSIFVPPASRFATPSSPAAVSIDRVGSVNSHSSSDDSDGELRVLLGSPSLSSQPRGQPVSVSFADLKAKYSSKHRHWLNSIKFYVCAASIPLCLFFVLLAGTASIDVLSIGYVTFALYFSYNASWVATTGADSWKWIQIYNYFVLFLQLCFQIPWIPSPQRGDSVGGWLRAFGLKKLTVWSSQDGAWAYDNTAFQSTGVLYDLIILVLLALQARLFDTQTFQEATAYISARVIPKAREKKQQWEKLLSRDIVNFRNIETNEDMSRNRLIALKQLRHSGGQPLHDDQPDDHSDEISRQRRKANLFQSSFDPNDKSNVVRSRQYIPYTNSSTRTAANSAGEPLTRRDDDDDDDNEEDNNGAARSTPIRLRETWSSSASPAVIVIPDDDDDDDDDYNKTSGASQGNEPAADEPRSAAASSTSEAQLTAAPSTRQRSDDDSDAAADEDSGYESGSSPFLPAKGPKPPGTPIGTLIDQSYTRLCDAVYQYAKFRDREPGLGRTQALVSGLFLIVQFHSYLIIYTLMVIDMVVNASLISVFYPLALFGYAVLEYPIPPKRYWQLVLLYTSFDLLLKVFFNIPGTLSRITRDALPPWLGIPYMPPGEFLSSSYLVDLFLWLGLIWHRSILKQLGLWSTAGDFRRQGNAFTLLRYDYRSQRLAIVQERLLQATSAEQPPAVSEQQLPAAPTLADVLAAKRSTAGESLPVAIGGGTRSALMSAVQRVVGYFRVVTRRQSPTSDYYTHILVIDVLSFFLIAFFPHPFSKVSSTEVTDFFTGSNRIPRAYLGVLLFQFCAIIFERVLYLYKSVTLKLVTQYAALLFYHLVIFVWLIPSPRCHSWTEANCNRFTDSAVLIIFYLLKCLYFYYSAKQIRRGYPVFYDQNRFSVEPNVVNYGVQNVYEVIPFLWEARSLLDWTFTPTTLTFFYWMNLEDISTQLWVAAYNAWSRNFGDRVRGERQAIVTKILLGVGGFLLLVVIIWLPLFLLSTANPSNVPNPVLQSNVIVGVQGWSPFYTMSQEQNITGLTKNQYHRLQNGFPDLPSDSYKEAQQLSLLPYSQSLFQMSPPSKLNLVRTLRNASKTVQMQVDFAFTRARPVESPVSVGHHRAPLNQRQKNQLADILEVLEFSNYDPADPPSFAVDDFFPRILHLPITGPTRVPSSSSQNEFFDCVMVYRRDIEFFVQDGRNYSQVLEYWEINQVPQLAPTGGKKQLNFTALGPQVILLSDSFPTGFSASLASAGVIGLYVGIVFTVAAFVRSWLTGNYANIPYQQMPEPGRIRRLCEDIYSARQFRDLNLEEELYWELIELYRSPERIIKVTRPFPKVKTD